MINKLTIITPVYNRSDVVGRCIESVDCAIAYYKAHGGAVEIEQVVCDDGSTDNTVSTIEAYAARMPHLRLITLDKNRGTNAARNAAIAAAQGEMCCMLDSDDYFVPEALSIILSAIAEHDEYSIYLFGDEDRQSYYQNNHLTQSDLAILKYEDFLSGRVTGDFVIVISTELLRSYPFDEKLKINEGIFMLVYQRTAEHILFTNKVTTIRERNRSDCATRLFIRFDVPTILRQTAADELLLQLFEGDYIKYGLESKITEAKLRLLDNYILAGNYSKARDIYQTTLSLQNTAKGKLLATLGRLRLGRLYRGVLSTYLKLKYN